MTGSATLNLVQTESIQKIVIPHFNTIHESMVATIEAVKYDPSAVELIDDIILNATKANPEQSQNRFFWIRSLKVYLSYNLQATMKPKLI